MSDSIKSINILNTLNALSRKIIASKNNYDLNDDNSNKFFSTSITYDRINEAEQIYIGLPVANLEKKRLADFPRIESFSSSEMASTVVINSKIDKTLSEFIK